MDEASQARHGLKGASASCLRAASRVAHGNRAIADAVPSDNHAIVFSDFASFRRRFRTPYRHLKSLHPCRRLVLGLAELGCGSLSNGSSALEAPQYAHEAAISLVGCARLCASMALRSMD